MKVVSKKRRNYYVEGGDAKKYEDYQYLLLG